MILFKKSFINFASSLVKYLSLFNPSCSLLTFGFALPVLANSNLSVAINQAYDYHLEIKEEFGIDILMQDEATLINSLQSGFVNFYKPATVNQYVAIAAKGPWIITSHDKLLLHIS